MKVYADLHLHSPFSRATSEKMNPLDLVGFAKIKGLNLLGTGDALHPAWLSQLSLALEEVDGTGLYKARGADENVLFLVEAEVETVHLYEGRVKRIHHVIFMPSLEVAEQLGEALSRYGDLERDGRPTLTIKPSELVETILGVDDRCLVFPAHAWTPWRSIFGSFSGVDSIEECYEDMAKRIYALETGLSSDPAMNWRVSRLDRFTLLSFSDSHSPWPWRLGRECTIFNLSKLSYKELIEAIRTGKVATLEVPPEYGKYHYSGHRECGVGPLSPAEASKLNYRCPVCSKPLTKGVEDRVEELADRPSGFKPEKNMNYVKVLPLHEVISAALKPGGMKSLQSKVVGELYENLVVKLGSEYNVLLHASYEELIQAAPREVAIAIIMVREGRYRIIPGYDGVYGKLELKVVQKGLEGFLD
ncbi:MAG: DNA helicase UvrD [Thermoprotei archaeon]|nr:MAG: DNA helicase UvrD [Thermoprotei archaeon]